MFASGMSGSSGEDLLPKLRRERAWIRTAAHEDDRPPRRYRNLLVRNVHDGVRIRTPHAAPLPHVRRQPDDGGPGRLLAGGRVVGQANPLADRIGVAEIHRRRGVD